MVNITAYSFSKRVRRFFVKKLSQLAEFMNALLMLFFMHTFNTLRAGFDLFSIDGGPLKVWVLSALGGDIRMTSRISS